MTRSWSGATSRRTAGSPSSFRRPDEGPPAEESLRTGAVQAAEALGFVDGMGR